MLASNRIIVCLTVAGVLASLGGCVSSATHNKVLASRDALQLKVREVNNENSRLKTGLLALAKRCQSAQTRIRSLAGAVSRLKTDERRVAEALDNLYRLVSAQAGSTAALNAATAPLLAEIDGLRAQTAALLSKPVSQPLGLSETTALRTAPIQAGP